MSVYSELGVTPVVNAAGTKTRLGGVRMDPRVAEAILEAGRQSIDMFELQAAASWMIVKHTGAEAGCVTSGAAAGMTLSAAACITGSDPALIDRLPDTRSLPNRILIYRSHRNSYDHAWRAAGARLVDIGLDDVAAGSGVRKLDRWEIEAAIDERTVAIAFVANEQDDPSLEFIAGVAHDHDLPVIVDAAAELPPVENLRRFIAAGADLVSFSGGKAIGGPQNTGILCGRKDLVRAALLNFLDMDVHPTRWRSPGDPFASGEANVLPRHGIGRGFKVSKENIVGLLVALDLFSQGSWQERAAEKAGFVDRFVQLVQSSGNHARPVTTRGFPRVEFRLANRKAAEDLADRLALGDPPIIVEETDPSKGLLTVDTIGLDTREEELILERLGELLGVTA